VYFDEKNLVLLIVIIAFTFTCLGVFLVAMANINIKANARRQLELVKNAMETQEKERARIARDLHDSIGQQISAIRLHIGLLAEINDKEELLNAIKEKQSMMSRATDELRTITRNLMPASINEYGLARELNGLVESLCKTNDIRLRIENSNAEKRYLPEFEINLFRIIQEMINNTIKYSAASEIVILLKHGTDYLQIKYTDNGSGFDPAKIKHGLGLRNIEARTKFYLGDYELFSSINKGTEFILTFKNSEIEPYAV
jgi:signal transduction histidine kinase